MEWAACSQTPSTYDRPWWGVCFNFFFFFFGWGVKNQKLTYHIDRNELFGAWTCYAKFFLKQSYQCYWLPYVHYFSSKSITKRNIKYNITGWERSISHLCTNGILNNKVEGYVRITFFSHYSLLAAYIFRRFKCNHLINS